MMQIGLMPSSTGKPGGLTTGQKMADYPIPEGRFLDACAELARKQFGLPWVDQGFKSPISYRTIDAVELHLADGIADMLVATVGSHFTGLERYMPEDKEINKLKIKYVCSSCGVKVWGKKGLKIACGSCKRAFRQATMKKTQKSPGTRVNQ